MGSRPTYRTAKGSGRRDGECSGVQNGGYGGKGETADIDVRDEVDSHKRIHGCI